MKTNKEDGFIHIEIDNQSRKVVIINTYSVVCELYVIREKLIGMIKNYYVETGILISYEKIQNQLKDGIILINQKYEFDF